MILLFYSLFKALLLYYLMFYSQVPTILLLVVLYQLIAGLTFSIISRAKLSNSLQLQDRRLNVHMVFLPSILCIYLINIGVPALAADSEVAKLLVNSNFFISRILRAVAPALLFLIMLRFESSPKRNLFIAALFVIYILTGFKGYVVSYFFLPVIFALFISDKLSVFSAIAWILVALVTLLSVITFTFGSSLIAAVEFLFGRLVISQFEAITVLTDNLVDLRRFDAFELSISPIIGRLTSSPVPGLNEVLFTMLHGANPFRMQLAVPLLFEIYLFFGLIPAVVYGFLEPILLWRAVELVRVVKRNFSIGALFLIWMAYLDICSNGGFVVKIIDLFVSCSLWFASLQFFYALRRVLPVRISIP